MISRIADLKELTALFLRVENIVPSAPAIRAMFAGLPALVQLDFCLSGAEALLDDALSTVSTCLKFMKFGRLSQHSFEDPAQLSFAVRPQPALQASQGDELLAHAFAAALQRLVNLRSLTLEGCELVGACPAVIGPAIGSLACLRCLLLTECYVGAGAARVLAPHVARLLWLTHLTSEAIAGIDDLGVAGARALMPHLARMPRLQCVEVRGRREEVRRHGETIVAGAELQAALQESGGVEVCIL